MWLGILCNREKTVNLQKYVIIAMVYQLTYELKSPERDYSSLYNFLEKEAGNSSIHVLRDSWWIYSEKEETVENLCDRIRPHLGDKDIFYLSELRKDAINGWMPSSHWKWYNEHKKLEHNNR